MGEAAGERALDEAQPFYMLGVKDAAVAGPEMTPWRLQKPAVQAGLDIVDAHAHGRSQSGEVGIRTLVVRLYRPRPEILSDGRKFPEAKPVN